METQGTPPASQFPYDLDTGEFLPTARRGGMFDSLAETICGGGASPEQAANPPGSRIWVRTEKESMIAVSGIPQDPVEAKVQSAQRHGELSLPKKIGHVVRRLLGGSASNA